MSFCSKETSANDGCSGNVGGGMPPPTSHGIVDLQRLPDTIPGVSRGELADRLCQQHRKLVRDRAQVTASHLVDEIDSMRRAMPPEEFKQFLRDLEALRLGSEKKAMWLSSLSPVQLYRHQRRERLRLRFHLLWKTLVLFVSVFGCVFFIFFFFIFFN
ncbi:hypothetical protein TRVL_06174 [Trypanosoma vivax]|nr:hypothetical protein TRVL_06174 [Trypanosoma vivax]